MTALAEWENFYLIVGWSAGAIMSEDWFITGAIGFISAEAKRSPASL